MTVMSKLQTISILLCGFPFLCLGQEEKKTTLPADKMTLEKARAALAKSEGEKGFKRRSIFDLPKETKPAIVDTKLTYRKALAAQKAESKEFKRLTAELDEKRRVLANMIRSYGSPPADRKQYYEAKAAYIKARYELRKMTPPEDSRVLFRKPEKK